MARISSFVILSLSFLLQITVSYSLIVSHILFSSIMFTINPVTTRGPPSLAWSSFVHRDLYMIFKPNLGMVCQPLKAATHFCLIYKPHLLDSMTQLTDGAEFKIDLKF